MPNNDVQSLLDDPTATITPEQAVEMGLLTEDAEVLENTITEENKVADTVAPDDKGDAAKEQEYKTEAPIISPSGNEIPFKVLKNTREAKAKITAELEQSNNQIADLQALVSQLQQSQAPQAEQAQGIADEAGIDLSIDPDTYREEFGDEIGDLAEGLQKVLAVNANLAYEIDSLKQDNNFRATGEANQISSDVQEEIDQNPFLAAWQASEDPKWGQAVNLDSLIKDSPQYSDMGYKERFDIVVNMVNAANGDAPVSTTKNVNIDAKLKEANAPEINSLSQITSEADLRGEKEAVESMGVHDINSKFNQMSPAAQEKWLSENMGG